MFQDADGDSVHINSTWKIEEPESCSAGTQTSVILADDKATEPVQKKHVEVQTDDADDVQLNVNEQPFDKQKVLAFLKRVYPLVRSQLTENISSHAFHGYDVDWSEDYGGLDCMHTLTEPYLSSEIGVSGVSWSATGSTVAVSFGRLDHEHLCTHKAGVCTWNIDRQSLDANKADVMLDCMSCVMCVAFHPSTPGVLCAGTYNGDVLVWDLSKTDAKPIHASPSENSHQDPVTSVVWTIDVASRGKKYQIQSVGSDGKVLTWALPNQTAAMLDLVAGHVLRTGNVVKSLKGGSTAASGQFGASSVSFSTFDRRQFVVGCDSGNVFKCNLGHQTTSGNKGLRSPDASAGKPTGGSIGNESQMKSPITFPFVPLKGPVYGIDCSPFHRNVFLSCGTDGCIHFCSVLQNRPLFSADAGHGYLYSIRWSPVRPLVCAVGSADGHLLLYDFKSSQSHPVLSLEGDSTKRAIVAVEFNCKRPQYVACGGVNGSVKVYRLSHDLSHAAANETRLLKDLIEA
eukprot:scpid41299/ scgid6082/ WD repeat-containing protein 34